MPKAITRRIPRIKNQSLIKDYTSANKVQLLLVCNMGEVIIEINAGGFKGLIAIGYLAGIKKPFQKQVTVVFEHLY
jgi:hypothetical protein